MRHDELEKITGPISELSQGRQALVRSGETPIMRRKGLNLQQRREAAYLHKVKHQSAICIKFARFQHRWRRIQLRRWLVPTKHLDKLFGSPATHDLESILGPSDLGVIHWSSKAATG